MENIKENLELKKLIAHIDHKQSEIMKMDSETRINSLKIKWYWLVTAALIGGGIMSFIGLLVTLNK